MLLTYISFLLFFKNRNNKNNDSSSDVHGPFPPVRQWAFNVVACTGQAVHNAMFLQMDVGRRQTESQPNFRVGGEYQSIIAGLQLGLQLRAVKHRTESSAPGLFY